MLRKAATYVVPAASVTITAAVLLGPGAIRPAVGLRVYGTVGSDTRHVALRVRSMRRAYGVDDAVAVGKVRVEAASAGARWSPWEGSTDADGVAEVVLDGDGPLRDRLELRALRGDELLAAGEVKAEAPLADEPKASPLVGRTSGDIALTVEAVRGTLAAPFADDLRIRAIDHTASSPVPGAHLRATVVGGDAMPAQSDTDSAGTATIAVRPLAHDVELSIEAEHASARGQWTGGLPVVPGALWLAPRNDNGHGRWEIETVSPVPRARAYVSLVGPHGRVAGAVIPLARDAQGFHRGTTAFELATDEPWISVTVSGDPEERGVGTAAWPLMQGHEGASSERVRLLLDGVPQAVEAEQRRAWRARRAGMMVVGVAALFEVLLLVAYSRRSQRRLEAHLARVTSAESTGGPPDASDHQGGAADSDLSRIARGESSWMRLAMLALLVLLGFCLVAALATFRY